MICRAAILSASLLAACAFSAEFQVKTLDGQTVQGEYLGTEKEVVKLRSKYGVVQIPSRDIASLVRLNADGKRADGGDKDRGDPQARAEKPLFPEPRKPDIPFLVAARSERFTVPEPDKNERQELFRLVRNFADSNDTSRRKIIRSLQDYGRMAYPFIAASYTEPFDIQVRVDLMQALVVPNSPFAASILYEAHRDAERALTRVITAPPQLPPDYLTRRDREQPVDPVDGIRLAAQNVLRLEGYASVAGGPFNALFLLEVYRERYGAEKVEPLLIDLSRDRTRLANTAGDLKSSKSVWTLEDRRQLIEALIPLLFSDNGDLQILPRDLLKKLLPSGAPKWEASEEEWARWWKGVKL
ncbi:MAG TPA: hypothetical protein VEK08_23630 [Planctomycetota bacterium]|nr:hypothetical protein [Planctomycetota bacterium]